jgi:hypothetical protein
LTLARRFPGATGNYKSGYFGGGGPGPRSTMDKISYSTDTTAAVPGGNLTAARYSPAATSAGNNGFTNPTPQTTTSLVPTPNTGYFGGGNFPRISSMDKVTYSTDTTAAVPGANLTVLRGYFAATGNSTAGYFGGGSPGPVTSMEKVTYSSDTTAAVPGANLSAARYGLAATGNSTAGYFGGGGTGPRSTMDKVTYSTDTTVAVSGANLSVARYGVTATGNSTAGYFGGGSPGVGSPSGNVRVSLVDKVTYSSDTTAAVPGANLSLARYDMGATGNSTHGYFGGGFPGVSLYTPVSTMDKVTYASDTTAAVPGANLTAARYGLAATGNSTAGYFGGGNPNTSLMDKVTYSTDTTVAVPGANFSIARNALAASSARANGLPETILSPVPVYV